MKRKRHILAFFLAVCMICTNLSVQAAGALDLYAVWKVRVTLDAGEGVFTGGATEEEKALAASGVSTGSFEVNTQSRYSTGLSAKRDGYGFVEWNTELDGSTQNRKNDRCEDDSGECHNRFSFRHFGYPLSLFLCL